MGGDGLCGFCGKKVLNHYLSLDICNLWSESSTVFNRVGSFHIGKETAQVVVHK